MKKPILAMMMICMTLLLSCSDDSQFVLFDLPHGRWVSIGPIQCLGNPWEQDWLESHDSGFSRYPRDFGVQAQIIHNFFERQGVDVRAVRKEDSYSATCEACSCPAGYTLYILISPAHVEKMQNFGFQVAE